MEEEVEGNDNMSMYERRRISQSGVQNQKIDRPISTKKLEKVGCGSASGNPVWEICLPIEEGAVRSSLTWCGIINT
ncbi:hypothetical protein GOBAR_DD28696 [Gossypium barbadense]|nr:hypothetical protein GOBAR_DD28696 [Gossypium barbadense]